MAEPDVEIDLNLIEDSYVREMFDQLRRWHAYREDRNAPAMQTFEGVLRDTEEVILEVDGLVYGYSGMTTILGDYWIPMLFSVTVPATEQCYFALETENFNGTFVKVRCNAPTSGDKEYRVTVLYRGNPDGN